MTIPPANAPTPHKPLRLWPGVVAALLLSLAWFGSPILAPGAMAFGVLGRLLGAVAVVVWWVFLSRAPRSERWGAVVLMIVAPFATSRVVHESIVTGMMGMMFFLYSIPVQSLGLVAWAVASRRLAVAHGPGGWSVEERWTSAGLKPYFNDFVVHNGHAFGFDGGILACIDLQDGKRKWKGGRYGHGQLVLLLDQDLLLVLSEEGELVLVLADPDRFTELSRFQAIEGKTWNHPVLVGSVLLVRNGQKMVAFRMSLARG